MEIETITEAPVANTGTASEQQPDTKIEAKPDDSGSKKPDETPAEKKWRLKFGKNEREVSEKELIAEAQKSWAADEKFKAAKAIERQVKEAIEKGDLGELTKRIKGKSEIEYAKEILMAELKRRQMTPEEKEKEDLASELAKMRKEKEDMLKAEADKRHQERVDAYSEQYDKEMAAAVEKHKVPKNKYVFGRAVKIAEEIVDSGREPDWDLVVGEAKRQWVSEMMEAFDNTEDYSFFGADRVKKLASWMTKQGMSKQDANKTAAKIVKQEEQAPDTKLVDTEEYWEKKRKMWSK